MQRLGQQDFKGMKLLCEVHRICSRNTRPFFLHWVCALSVDNMLFMLYILQYRYFYTNQEQTCMHINFSLGSLTSLFPYRTLQFPLICKGSTIARTHCYYNASLHYFHGPCMIFVASKLNVSTCSYSRVIVYPTVGENIDSHALIILPFW